MALFTYELNAIEVLVIRFGIVMSFYHAIEGEKQSQYKS